MTQNKLQQQTASILKNALELWPDLWERAHAIEGERGQAVLDELAEEARLQAVLLLSLARSIQKAESVETSEEDDPKSVLYIIHPLAASYSLLALCVEPSELSPELLLRPEDIPATPFLEKRAS